MSVSSPLSPLCLESNKFTFEQPLRPQHYLSRVFKMIKFPLLLTTLTLTGLATLMLSSVHGAPVLSLHATSRSLHGDLYSETDIDQLYAALPSPPIARDERDANGPNSTPVPTAPVRLPFIKNAQCSLHLPGGETTPKMCGLRQLDVAEGESGIKSWKPSRCRPYHCKCVATREVQRIKRTIADNKTTLDYHRFRVFECV